MEKGSNYIKSGRKSEQVGEEKGAITASLEGKVSKSESKREQLQQVWEEK